MSPSRRAVIDVGTNPVKLLVAEVAGHQVRPLWEESKQTRLGEGFYETHQLQREAIHATAYFAAEFAQIARSYKPESVRLIATSAAPDALNQADLLQALEQKTGLKPENRSGVRRSQSASACWGSRRNAPT